LERKYQAAAESDNMKALTANPVSDLGLDGLPNAAKWAMVVVNSHAVMYTLSPRQSLKLLKNIQGIMLNDCVTS
jgi:hypothetical protein